MLRTVEVDVVTCDACGSEGYDLGDGVPEDWYYGEVTYGDTAGKQRTGDWHACKSAHIKKAVMVAVDQVERPVEED